MPGWKMSKPGDSNKRHFSTPQDSDMDLLTLGHSDIEMCNKRGHGP